MEFVMEIGLIYFGYVTIRRKVSDNDGQNDLLQALLSKAVIYFAGVFVSSAAVSQIYISLRIESRQ